MSGLIHINMMRAMLRSGEAVSLKFWREDGEIISVENAICTSSYYHGNTFQLKLLTSGQWRKVRAVTIFEINDMEIFL
jgi:hypothetical protein